MNEPLLAADSIDFAVKDRMILRSVYVDAVPRRVTALVGRSGAGKTTLLWILVGLRRPQGGQVRSVGAWDCRRCTLHPSPPCRRRQGHSLSLRHRAFAPRQRQGRSHRQ